MQITVTIPDELAAQAQARGIVLDRYLPELLADDLAAEAESQPAPGVMKSEETADELTARRHAAVEAMLDSPQSTASPQAARTSRAWCMKAIDTDASGDDCHL